MLSTSSNTVSELQMLLLFMIGQLVERVAPTRFFDLRTHNSSLRFSIGKFPSAKVGYTISFRIYASEQMRCIEKNNESKAINIVAFERRDGSISFRLCFVRNHDNEEEEKKKSWTLCVQRSTRPGGRGGWYNRKDDKTEKESIQTTSLPFTSMKWRPGRSWCSVTMTHVNSSVMLFVDGKSLSVQNNLTKKSSIVFPRSVATGLIGGNGFVGHLGPISLFRGVPPDDKSLQQLHLASSCSVEQPLTRICLISPDASNVCAREMYVFCSS